MTTYIVPACNGHSGSSLCTPPENQSCTSFVGAVVALEMIFTIIFVISLTGRTWKRVRTMMELCTNKLALLHKQLHISNDFGCVYGMLQHGMASLIYILARFPFNSNTVNTWFRVPQKDVSEGGVVLAINLDNTGRTQRLYSPQYDVAFPDGLEDERHILFFHGTSHEGAQNILKEGIDLKEGTKKGDFSNGRGFYLTDDFRTAFEWADSRFHQSQAAVLVFRFDRSCLGEYKRNSMDLCGKDARDEWANVLRKCRSGRGLEKKALRGINFIEGPMATISKANVRAVSHSYQLCILKEEMAEAFDECLHSVVFHSKFT